MKNQPPLIVATIWITDRYFLLALGQCLEPQDPVVCDVNFDPDLKNSRDVVAIGYDAQSKQDMEVCITQAISRLLNMIRSKKENGDFSPEQKLDALTIGCCVALRSTATSDRDRKSADYGQIAKQGMQPTWANIKLYHLAVKCLKGHLQPHNIWVRSDSSLAALGDYHWRLSRNTLASPVDMARLRKKYADPYDIKREANKDTCLAYMKVSADINGSVAFEGELLGGKNHPSLGMIRPRRMQSKHYRDAYPGNCTLHGDCYSGLISSSAIEDRLERFYKGLTSEIQLKMRPEDRDAQKFNTISGAHPVVTLVVYYLAQACIAMIGTHVPSLIVMGGRLLDDKLDENQRAKDIEILVGKEIRRQLRLDNKQVEVPYYPDLKRSDGFVQLAECRLPGVYGGLVLAARKHQYHNDKKRNVAKLAVERNG